MVEKIPYETPGWEKKAFNCPFCNAYANQDWYDLRIDRGLRVGEILKELKVCFCSHCNEFSIWYQHKMIYPEFAGIEPLNGDLDPD
ncbi:MAG: DUF4145 domain-containing protein, partial [Caldisericum sp.]